MNAYGNDWEYANNRLQGTIVRLNDEPVFVHEVRRDMKAEVSKLEDIYNAFIADGRELDLTPVPLGMCNFNHNAHYLSRVPLRRDWRQGLRRENFISPTCDHAAIPPALLAKVIKGEYPALKECFDLVKKGALAAAWSRRWAIGRDSTLIYKNKVVGTSKDGVLLLNKEFQFLAEALEEAV